MLSHVLLLEERTRGWLEGGCGMGMVPAGGVTQEASLEGGLPAGAPVSPSIGATPPIAGCSISSAKPTQRWKCLSSGVLVEEAECLIRLPACLPARPPG